MHEKVVPLCMKASESFEQFVPDLNERISLSLDTIRYITSFSDYNPHKRSTEELLFWCAAYLHDIGVIEHLKHDFIPKKKEYYETGFNISIVEADAISQSEFVAEMTVLKNAINLLLDSNIKSASLVILSYLVNWLYNDDSNALLSESLDLTDNYLYNQLDNGQVSPEVFENADVFIVRVDETDRQLLFVKTEASNGQYISVPYQFIKDKEAVENPANFFDFEE